MSMENLDLDAIDFAGRKTADAAGSVADVLTYIGNARIVVIDGADEKHDSDSLIDDARAIRYRAGHCESKCGAEDIVCSAARLCRNAEGIAVEMRGRAADIEAKIKSLKSEANGLAAAWGVDGID